MNKPIIPIIKIQYREKEPCPYCKHWLYSSVNICQCSGCKTDCGYKNYDARSRYHYIAMMLEHGQAITISNKQYNEFYKKKRDK